MQLLAVFGDRVRTRFFALKLNYYNCYCFLQLIIFVFNIKIGIYYYLILSHIVKYIFYLF